MEDINGAVEFGRLLTENEDIGYTIGATLANSNETDCSDFIWWCLKNNGFNVPSSRWNTTTMIPYLQNYDGFTEYIYTLDFVWQHGDIAVYDEGGGVNGHTFFYAENIRGYATQTENVRTMLSRARVEASSNRGHAGNGDSQYEGYGAYWEVWTHLYSPPTSGHTWHVFRWNGEPVPPHPTNYHKTKNWLYTRKDNNTKFIFQN